MESLAAPPTRPLNPRKRSSAPASTSADAYRPDDAHSGFPPIHVPSDGSQDGSAGPSHLRLNTKPRQKALTIHTSEFPSPSSSPGHSPSNRPRPLPRVPVPQSAPSDSASTSFRRLPRTPAPSHSEGTTPSIPILQPEELPPRKDSLRPLCTPGTGRIDANFAAEVERAERAVRPQVTIASTPSSSLFVANRDESPISPATTVASVLVFRRGTDSSDDDADSDDDDDEALRRRRWRQTRGFGLKASPANIPASLSPGGRQVPRESRHWYREEKGQLVEQDYDQVVRSLRML
jgi:hypothetical protein